ncbi:MAG: hypothetical protein V3V99_05845 [candidate division Zixibacteria bacterium]
MLFKTKNKGDVSSAVKPKSQASFSPSATGIARDSMSVSVSGYHSSNKTGNAESCPDCGGYLARIGYCFSCIACGWGGCS